MAHDPTHGRMVEVGAEHGDRPVSKALAERAPRRPARSTSESKWLPKPGSATWTG